MQAMIAAQQTFRLRRVRDRRWSWAAVTLLFSVIAGMGGTRSVWAVESHLISDVPYQPAAATAYERERCKLDLYLPKERDFPTIVWFHGGGLQNGDKADSIAVGLGVRFSREGIAVASVNYRLSPRVTFPAYIEDAAAAVAFIHRTIATHGGSADRVFVAGHSAGAYLATMLVMDAQYLQAQKMSVKVLAGCVPVSGQMITHSTVRDERGTPRTQPIIDRAAPAFFARADTVPIFCIAGGDDLPARAEENRYFVATLRAAGNESVNYLEVPHRDHTTIASRMDESEDVVAREMMRFIGDIPVTRR